MGCTPIDRRASICSVTFMVPISAAIDEPTRPASMSPVMVGPSSRSIPMLTITPPMVSMSTSANWKRAWVARTAPVKAPVMMTTSWER